MWSAFFFSFLITATASWKTTLCMWRASARSANVTDFILYLTYVQEVIRYLNDNYSDFHVFLHHKLSSFARQCMSLAFISSGSYRGCICYFFMLWLLYCLLDTNKRSSWRLRYWSNSTQGAHSHPVTDAMCLWDNGLMGITYRKDSGMGLHRMLLKLQHYWLISPLSLLEHKNERQHEKNWGAWGLTIWYLW